MLRRNGFVATRGDKGWMNSSRFEFHYISKRQRQYDRTAVQCCPRSIIVLAVLHPSHVIVQATQTPPTTGEAKQPASGSTDEQQVTARVMKKIGSTKIGMMTGPTTIGMMTGTTAILKTGRGQTSKGFRHD